MVTKEKDPLPKVGLLACFSGGSNTGSLTGLAALEVVRQLGRDVVGICSLPALLNQVPRQSALVRKIEKIIVIDGCHNECTRQLLAGMGIVPDVYLNLETDLHLSKQGPFTSLGFTEGQLNRVIDAILAAVEKTLNTSESS
ncbi:MAG: putative zinc-binding protein [Anaerolineae bacterium]|jgi:uncharacterized metal-binding protein|nr:putative zinc-binding protein [Anaerolineae bacterium]MDH7474948.1 putative zinc-binding protein [Anaerolineae bacterium]